MHDERFSKGLAVLDRLAGPAAQATRDSLAALSPEFADMIISHAFGEVVSREGLGLRDREIATLSCLASRGGLEPQLRWHVKAALNAGLTPVEIVEIFIHLSAYAGIPAALNALTAAKDAFAEAGVPMPHVKG